MAKTQDKFSQILSFSVEMSAANTLTFGELAVGISVFDYAAFIITRIEYSLAQASYAELTTNSDFATIAITGSDSIDAIYDVKEPAIYDAVSFMPIVSGAPATSQVIEIPTVHDFSSHEGGGLLVPAQNLYIGCQTAGFANAASAQARVYYKTVAMQAADYLELAQRLRVLST